MDVAQIMQSAQPLNKLVCQFVARWRTEAFARALIQQGLEVLAEGIEDNLTRVLVLLEG